MNTEHSSSWALLQIEGWKAACNTLDTLFYYELAQAAQRRRNNRESRIQSARRIRDNMLNRMNHFREYGAREAESERHLIRTIYSTLKSDGCFFNFRTRCEFETHNAHSLITGNKGIHYGK
ncbi:MAG TPA: hypothetical protein ENJ08_10415 [Gammaproteobacteria bacterium]|nr:hypothetical protein [Gammaproteobacteria bacterium]